MMPEDGLPFGVVVSKPLPLPSAVHWWKCTVPPSIWKIALFSCPPFGFVGSTVVPPIRIAWQGPSLKCQVPDFTTTLPSRIEKPDTPTVALSPFAFGA